MVTVIALLCACLLAAGPGAQCAQAASDEVSVLKDLVYKSTAGLSDYEQVRCKLDLYLPQGKTGFATLVWFHGGALKEGNKDDQFNVRIAKSLANAGLGVAMANYRLSPRAKYPSYVEDAAAAVAWAQKHIAEHGGDPKRVFVGGHSAGGYLTFMIGLDGRYLRQAGSAPGSLAGLIPVSGQTMTHYTIRDERGLPHDTIIADEAAPIHYARKDAPPMLVLYADHDMPARAEENQFLVAALKAAGAKQVTGQMISDRDHGSVAGNIAQPGDPAAQAILAFIDSTASQSASVSTPQGEAAFAGPHFGVNLAGAEFAGDKLPGVFNRNYTYPTAVDLDYFQVRGRTLIRLPFLWERMQHALNGPLDPDELARLRGVLQAAAQRRMHVILDPHSYGRYHLAGEKESQIIGSERVPVEAFADFWTKLAGAVKEEPALYAYALMNEPHDMGDAERWPRAAQAAVNAIRGVDGRTTIIVPGDGWSSARGWQGSPNRDLDVKVRDPRTNLVFEAHCYFDKDGSG
ncbi:MAG TPA: cellulase family glycosylhydrolase, partial [Bacillota bacterium]|nr:cellulase family glycosylhydrolase [Bacillota bacterium]